MKFYLLILFFLPIGAYCENSNLELINVLGSEKSSNIERDNAVKELCKRAPLESAPFVLKLLEKNHTTSEPAMGSKPWLDDSHSRKAQIMYASHTVWSSIFSKSDSEKTHMLIQLYEQNQDSIYRPNLLQDITRAMWTKDSERFFVRLASKPEHSRSERTTGYSMLTHNLGHEWHARGIEYINTLENLPFIEQSYAFMGISGGGKKFFTLPPSMQQKTIRLGFKILEHASNENAEGYALVGRLSYLLKMQDGFFPSKKDKRYRTENGRNLNDKFFIETVQNAKKYSKQHRKSD